MNRHAKVDAADLLSAKVFEGFGDGVGNVVHVEEIWKRYWDDISGKESDGKLAKAAREEELTLVDEMGVWELRQLEECIAVTGKKSTKVRWVDVNKGDSEAPNVRSRIVAKDFKMDARPDFFAATPPLEYLMYLVSRCASSQLGRNKTKLMVQDVKKAYFCAPATRDVYVELLPERAQLGMCAKLNKSFYGTRDAALNWAQACTEALEKIGFVKGRSPPCSFDHAGWKIRAVVHGDDFLSEGPANNLKKMDAAMRKSFSLNTEILGGDPVDVQAIKVLNRQITWADGAIYWEADPRHVEIITKQLGMKDCKVVKTLGEKIDDNKLLRQCDLDLDCIHD